MLSKVSLTSVAIASVSAEQNLRGKVFADQGGFAQCQAEHADAMDRPWEQDRCPVGKDWTHFLEDKALKTMYNTSDPAGSLKALEAACKPFADISATAPVPLSTIAEAYFAAGMAEEYCPESLIIAGGECQQPVGDDKKPLPATCSKGNESGVFQCDMCTDALVNRSPQFTLFKDLTNVCYATWAQFVMQIVPKLAVPFNIDPDHSAWNKSCLDKDNGAWEPEKWYQLTDEQNNNTCSCNFMGPFCHKSFNPDRSQSTAQNANAWAGGSHLIHPQPNFQSYYRGRFLINVGKMQDSPTQGTYWFQKAPADFEGGDAAWFKGYGDGSAKLAPIMTKAADQYMYEHSMTEAQKICAAAKSKHVANQSVHV